MESVQVKWVDKMIFEGESRGLTTLMDAKKPFGDDSAMTPKEMVLAGLCGCTGMDVVALLKKFKQPKAESFTVTVEAQVTKGHPIVFSGAHLFYRFTGELDVEKVIEAVSLSKNQYCGVSAMLGKAFPITYSVELNGQVVEDSRD